VLKAVENVNTEICEAIVGLDAVEQSFIDRRLSTSTAPRTNRGLAANAMLAVLAGGGQGRCRGVRTALYRYLAGPVDAAAVPMMNVINGGAHATTASTCRSS